MEKLAAYVVRKGALSARDAVGWIVRLCATLGPLHRAGASHGRVSDKAVQIAVARCDAAGHLLDAGDLVDDLAYFSLGRLDGGGPSPEDDTWAAGVLLYRMLTGELPFPGTTPAAVAARILKQAPAPLAVYDAGDDDLQLVLDRVLARNPADRLTSADSLRQALLAWDGALAGLTPLSYGRPGSDFDDDADIPTAVFRLKGGVPQPVAPAPLDTTSEDTAAVLHSDPSRALQARPIRPAGPKRRSVPPDPEPDADIRAQLRQAEAAIAPPPAPISQPAASQRSVVQRLEELSQLPTDVEPVSARGVTTLHYVLGAILVLAAAGIGWTIYREQRPSPSAPAPSAASSASAVRASPSPTAAPTSRAAPPTPPSSSPSSSPAPTPAPTAPPSAPQRPVTDFGMCIAGLFPEGTFSPSADLSFVCRETNAIKGAQAIHKEVVLGGGGDRGITDAMKEWSNIGWYAMAAFGVARAHCCAEPPALDTVYALEVCALDARITALGDASRSGDAAAAEAALDAYDKAIYCQARAGTAHLFGQLGMPFGGEREIFERMLARARD